MPPDLRQEAPQIAYFPDFLMYQIVCLILEHKASFLILTTFQPACQGFFNVSSKSYPNPSGPSTISRTRTVSLNPPELTTSKGVTSAHTRAAPPLFLQLLICAD